MYRYYWVNTKLRGRMEATVAILEWMVDMQEHTGNPAGVVCLEILVGMVVLSVYYLYASPK